MMKKTCVISFTMLLMAGSRPALAVRNGLDAAGEQTKSIFLLRSSAGGQCTAWAYKYKRCLVTAAHCVENLKFAAISTGIDTSSAAFKIAPVKKIATSRKTERWTDVAVLFTDELKGRNEAQDAKFLKTNDYLPLKVGADLGLQSVSDDNNPFLISDSVGAPKQSQLIGYGVNATNTAIDPPVDTGESIKRKGSPLVMSYVKGSSQTRPLTGSYYVVYPKTGDGNPTRIGCTGDSGAPLLVDGKSYGVYSEGAGRSLTCADSNVMMFTALDNSKVGTDKSNIEWLESAAEDLCGKAIHAAPKDAKTGKVSGIIYGGNTAPNTGIAKLNDAIACSDTSYDCDEMIHDDESVTLTATAKTNYAFDKWTDGAGNQSALCPCSLLDPSNPTCNFSYESVGFYPPVGDPDNLQNMGSSSEVAYCQANFKFSRPYPTGNQMSPTP